MKIGLALGSGSARGWAHIGVIEALEQLGIRADVIAGCSVGSYVGAVYANNNLDNLKTWVKSLNEWQVAGLMGVGFNRGAIANGEKVFKQLQEFSMPTLNSWKILSAWWRQTCTAARKSGLPTAMLSKRSGRPALPRHYFPRCGITGKTAGWWTAPW